jgi:hypothetical protein
MVARRPPKELIAATVMRSIAPSIVGLTLAVNLGVGRALMVARPPLQDGDPLSEYVMRQGW